MNYSELIDSNPDSRINLRIGEMEVWVFALHHNETETSDNPGEVCSDVQPVEYPRGCDIAPAC